MHWISPRESAGFRMLAASSEPSAEPAPTSVCSSSMKMMAFWFSISSFMMVLSRSSNWPRYLVPATISERSSARMRLSARNDGTSPSAMRCARPFHDGGLAHAGLADQHRVVLGAAAQDLHHALQFVIAADQRVERVVHGGLREVAAEFGQQRAFLGPRGGDFLALRARQLFADGGEAQAALVQNFGGEALLFAQQAQQQVLGADVLVVQALGFFGAVGQHALAFVAERQIHGSGNLFPRIVVCPSICLRMDSTAACERRKRFASALSSRSRPSSRCSVSI